MAWGSNAHERSYPGTVSAILRTLRPILWHVYRSSDCQREWHHVVVLSAWETWYKRNRCLYVSAKWRNRSSHMLVDTGDATWSRLDNRALYAQDKRCIPQEMIVLSSLILSPLDFFSFVIRSNLHSFVNNRGRRAQSLEFLAGLRITDILQRWLEERRQGRRSSALYVAFEER